MSEVGGDGVACALEAIYNWNYEPEIDGLRTLYANALERQWIAVRDLDWDREIDPAHAVANLEDPQQFPIGTLHTWHEEEIKELIGIPENVDTAALIPLGYPAQGQHFGGSKRKPIEEVTFHEKWGEK